MRLSLRDPLNGAMTLLGVALVGLLIVVAVVAVALRLFSRSYDKDEDWS